MSFDGSDQSLNDATRKSSIVGALSPSLQETVIALNERSKTFVTREDLKDFKDEILQAVDNRLSTMEQRMDQQISASVTRTDGLIKWAIGTVCMASMTLLVAIAGAAISAYSAFTEKTVNAPVYSSSFQPTPVPQRVEIVITVNGEEVTTDVKE